MRVRNSYAPPLIGGVSSNHALATAIYARRLGLDVTLVLLPEPRAEHVKTNLLAMLQTGAELRLAGPKAARHGADTYEIAMGGSSPLGTVGFVAAGFELAAQVASGALPQPDVVYAALGTGGSAVGLALGCAAAGLGTEVVAVRASSPGTSSTARLGRLQRQTLALLRTWAPTFPSAAAPRIEARQLGHGYALATSKSRAAAALALRHQLPGVEPTYTAKTLAALVADAERLKGKVVLLWLGGNSRPLPEPTATLADVPRELREWAK